jgi:hypothetical protein
LLLIFYFNPAQKSSFQSFSYVGDSHRGPLNNRENPLSFAKIKTQNELTTINTPEATTTQRQGPQT